jgi:tryptophan synthase alpha chain
MPIVLYTYLNPLLALGFERFHRDAEAAGVDGMLILDLPPDEDGAELAQAGTECDGRVGMRRIRLIAPTTPDERIARITMKGDGFIYYVSREGVTGEQAGVAEGVGAHIEAIRRTTSLPVVVGFGVSNPEQARQVAGLAEGVVVGSAIVKRIAQYRGEPEMAELVAEFVRPMAAAAKGGGISDCGLRIAE